MAKAYRKVLCLFIFAALLVLSLCVGTVTAGATNPNELPSTDCAQALTEVWDACAQLNAGDMENLIGLHKEINAALFHGINGNPAVLTPQQQEALLDKFHLYYAGLNFALTVEDYVKGHHSGGMAGYEGFIAAVQKNNRDIDYLADLYNNLRLTLPNNFRIDMNKTWDWGESERINFCVQYFKNVKFDGEGNIECQKYDQIINDYIIAKSKISKNDLNEVGFYCATLQAVFRQLTPAQQALYLEIACKMGRCQGAGINGHVYLEKTNPKDPEPDHAGTTVTVTQHGNIVGIAVSDSSGYYSIKGLNAGNCDVHFDNKNCGWKKEIRQVNFDGQQKEIVPVTLLIGDMNKDGAINILDLLWMAALMGDVHDADSQCADVNRDGVVNILDLLRVSQNIDK